MPSDPGGTRVLLVQHQELVRRGVAHVLASIDGVEVVADTGSAVEALRLARERCPDVAIVDVDHAEIDLPRFISELHDAADHVRVIAIAAKASSEAIEEALSAGAGGYVLKEISVGELAVAIERTASGEIVLDPAAASALAKGITAHRHGASHIRPKLTPRQREILQLLAAGMENKQIARRLGIGVHTVKTHVSRILVKLGVSSRTEAVVVAMRDKLIT